MKPLHLFCFLLSLTLHCTGAEPARPNVLFIAVDDLNHWVGHPGRNKQTKTPHLDRLAAMGVTFTRAYCAAPVCNPSRAALLSGKRPGVTGIYDNGNPYQKVLKADGSLVMQFKNAGYETLGMGKLWHGGLGFPEQWTATGGRERGGDHGGGEELYDHDADPYEWTNPAAKPEHAALKSDLTKHFPATNAAPSPAAGSATPATDAEKAARRAKRRAAGASDP